MVIIGVDRDWYGFIVAIVSPAMVMVYPAMVIVSPATMTVCPAGTD
jgi:hypothetical protein